jgi:hypothetical protein
MLDAEASQPARTIFGDEFIETLPDEPLEALHAVCEQFDRVLSSSISLDALTASAQYELLIDAYAFLQAFWDQNGPSLSISLELPSIEVVGVKNAAVVVEIFNAVYQHVRPALKVRQLRLHLENAEDQYVAKLGLNFGYAFDSEQVEQLKHLIKHVRRRMRANKDLEPYHVERLGNRLKAMLAAVAPSVPDLDTLYGGVIDLVVTLGRLGPSAAAMLKDVQELAALLSAVQREAMGLPALGEGLSSIRLSDYCEGDLPK